MAGDWSQEIACQVLNVCDGRSISDLGGEIISNATGGVISRETGKDVFHLGPVLGGLLLGAKILEAVNANLLKESKLGL